MESIGRYQIQGELGRGAMGVVFRAQDPAIGRKVAIKTIRLAEFSDPAERDRLRERLFREAQSAGILSHPGIVTVYDVGEQDELTYIAMEFVNGPTLEKVLLGEQPPEAATLLNILRQTAVALDYAHKKGIVHRDIKPANIMIDEDHSVKITDFGVAKVSHSHQLTQAGTVLGTPNYMSPEQVQGKPVDGRADQFALAVVAYEMLTGEKPFAGDQLTTVLYKIVSEEPPAPQHLNPTLGWPVNMVLQRALSKDAAKRYPSCTEFINALEAALKTKKDWKALPRGASQSLPTAVVGAPLGGSAARTRIEAPKPGRSRMWLQVTAASLAGLGVVALLFVGAKTWFSSEPEEQQIAPPASPAQAAPSRPAPMSPPPAAEQKAAPAQNSPAEAAPAVEAPKPEPPKPKPAVEAEPPPRRTERPPEAERAVRGTPSPADFPLQIVTSPPGAQAVVDHESAKTCTTPCSVQLTPGRHTLSASLGGYKQELRIVDMKREPQELFVSLTRPSGTVQVDSEPPGAQILINNQLRPETTPARFTLPAGKYTITVVRNGRRIEESLEVKDSSMTKLLLSP